MIDNTTPAAPAIPPVQPGTFRDTRSMDALTASKVRHEDTHAYIQWEKAGKHVTAPKAAPAPEVVPDDVQRQRVADLDRDLQAKGLQQPNNAATGGEPDPQLMQALKDWLRDAGSNPENLRKFEAGMAQAYRGRRYGETPSQFEARMAGTSKDAKPDTDAVLAAEGIDTSSDEYKSLSPAERDYAARIMVAEIPGKSIPKDLLHGFTLPADEVFIVGRTSQMLAQAKAAGFT